jgi:hypothetical protein
MIGYVFQFLKNEILKVQIRYMMYNVRSSSVEETSQDLEYIYSRTPEAFANIVSRTVSECQNMLLGYHKLLEKAREHIRELGKTNPVVAMNIKLHEENEYNRARILDLESEIISLQRTIEAHQIANNMLTESNEVLRKNRKN